jgi:hypothetical protein
MFDSTPGLSSPTAKGGGMFKHRIILTLTVLGASLIPAAIADAARINGNHNETLLLDA